MKKPISILFLLVVVNQLSLRAVDFSEKEKSIIYTNAVKLLEDYNTILNQIGESVVNDIDKTKSGQESFLELFVNRQVLIFNDLDPAHKLSEFYEAETYSSSLILWYPDGISVNLDLQNARVSDIISHEENVFSLDILVKKTINGNYLNQTMNRNVEELTFRIAFSMDNKSPSKFKIVGIRNAASKSVINYSQALKEVNSEDFSPEDLQKVQSELKTILQDYTQMLALIGDPQELPEDKVHYRESFLALFREPSVRIYNDISPDPESNLITAADYIASFVADYPEGVKNIAINTDSASFGKAVKSDDGSFYTYTDVNKFFSGSYKGKEAFRQMFPLTFKISFNAAGKTYSDFKITGIDISSVDFYEAAQGADEISRPEIVIRPVSRKGFSLVLAGSFGQTNIDDQDIKTLSVEQNSHSWNVSPLYNFITSVGVSYYFTDNISVRTGLEYNKYSTTFDLTGKFQNSTTSLDINSSTFYKMIEADYDSLVTINFITIPLLLNYTGGKPGKIGFYGDCGLKFSIPGKATYRNTGNYRYYGYYPNAPAVLQYIDFKELGYKTREDINNSGPVKISGVYISLYASAGINFPIGYYSSISAGPEVTFGISDLFPGKDAFTDIFGKSYSHQPTRIKNFGFRVSFNYKL